MPEHLDNSWMVFCESMYRANCRVTDADIKQAIEWYIEATGRAPKFIALHPKNAGLAVPAGIELRIIGGCLAFEVWLADTEPWPVKVYQERAVVQQQGVIGGQGCDKLRTYENLPTPNLSQEILSPGNADKPLKPGPRPLKLPDDRIKELAAEGMDSRSIAEVLESEGVEVSYRTIARRVKQKQGVLL